MLKRNKFTFFVYSFLLPDINHRRAKTLSTNDGWLTTNTNIQQTVKKGRTMNKNVDTLSFFFYRILICVWRDRHIHNINIHTTFDEICSFMFASFSIWAMLEFWLVDSVEYRGKLASPIFFLGFYLPFIIKNTNTHVRKHALTHLPKHTYTVRCCTYACI